MAITPVKTGNVTTPPPAKKIDAKLTTQFNAAAKAGETGPSTSTPPPFYTPREGTFKETRNFFGKAHNTRLNWKVNPYQVKDSDKVLISGSVTVDRDGKLTNYVIDGYNSYIAKNGDVYYNAAAIDKNNTYKANYNVFTTIGNNVKNALQAVLKNKNYFQLNNKTTPVSMASAALTQALMPVGEVNLTHGIGLNGIGSKIKTEINAQLSKTDKDPNKIRVRQAIALAVSEAGVKLTGGIIQTPLTTNATSNPRPLVNTSVLTATHMIEQTTNAERRRLNIADRRLTDAEAGTLIANVYNLVTQPEYLRNYAGAFAGQLAERGVLTWDGLAMDRNVNLIEAVYETFRQGQPSILDEFLRDRLGVGQILRANAIQLMRNHFPDAVIVNNVYNNLGPLVNNNVGVFDQIDPVGNAAARLDQTIGIVANQFGAYRRQG